MIWCTIVSILATVLYVGSVVWKTGEWPASISACVYAMKKQNSHLFWTLFIWVAGIYGMIPLMAKMGELSWIGLIGLIGFGFLGVIPLTDKDVRGWHYLIGITTGITSQVCVALASPWWLAVWLCYVPLFAGSMGAMNDSEEPPVICNGKGVLIIEVLCAIAVWGADLC